MIYTPKIIKRTLKIYLRQTLKLCCFRICCLFVNGLPTYEEDLQEPHHASPIEYHNFSFFAILF